MIWPRRNCSSFGCERLLYFHDQLGALKIWPGGLPMISAPAVMYSWSEMPAPKPAAVSMATLCPPRCQLPDRYRSEADAVFVRFDFLGNADEHCSLAGRKSSLIDPNEGCFGDDMFTVPLARPRYRKACYRATGDRPKERADENDSDGARDREAGKDRRSPSDESR